MKYRVLNSLKYNKKVSCNYTISNPNGAYKKAPHHILSLFSKNRKPNILKEDYMSFFSVKSHINIILTLYKKMI